MLEHPPFAQKGDPWFARLAFHLFQRVGPGWLTIWLILIIGGLIALGVVAGPWVPGAITTVAGLTAGGAAIAKRLGGRLEDRRPATQRGDRPPEAG
jgi:hypothetical protein